MFLVDTELTVHGGGIGLSTHSFISLMKNNLAISRPLRNVFQVWSRSFRKVPEWVWFWHERAADLSVFARASYLFPDSGAGPFSARADAALVVKAITELMAMPSAEILVIYGTGAAEGDVSTFRSIALMPAPPARR